LAIRLSRTFVLRKLHQLSGIVPLGIFLLEHFYTNSKALTGAKDFNNAVVDLQSIPYILFVEIGGIFIPLIYHGLYGLYIWYRGDSNVGDYPWTGNWLYTAQRWTGLIALVYITYHVIDMRFTGVHLMAGGYQYAFSKVWYEFREPFRISFYILGIVAAVVAGENPGASARMVYEPGLSPEKMNVVSGGTGSTASKVTPSSRVAVTRAYDIAGSMLVSFTFKLVPSVLPR